jgi:hypothetical protein
MGTMIKVLAVLMLVTYLLIALLYRDRPRLLDKPGRRERITNRVLVEPIAVLVGGPFLASPMVLLIADERERLSSNPVMMLLVPVAFVVAYKLVKLVSADRHKPQRLVLAGKALGLVAAVVAAELLARELGVPVLSIAGPLILLAIGAATAYLASMRVVEFGYWPALQVRLGRQFLAAVAVIVALTVWSGDPVVPVLSVSDGLTQFLVLLELAVVAVACTAAVAGCVRLRRWMRAGPPANPAPPGVAQWPPEEGEVWLAIITHEDERETHKERRVLVWKTTPTHVEVLTITTQNKRGDDRYLAMALADWEPVLTKNGWLSLEPRPLPYADLIKFMGYNRVTHLGDTLDRRVRTRAKSWPGFTPRHRRASAGNQHVGPHQEALAANSRPRSRTGSR